MQNSYKPTMKDKFRQNSSLLIAIVAILALLLFNLIRDPSFYNISLVDSIHGPKLAGNLVEVLDNATELVLIAIGMALVTSSCGGQDISVGAIGVISATVFTKVLIGMYPDPTGATPVAFGGILLAILAAIIVSMIFGLFNGSLVAFFRIQPMIATLILFTCGRDIAYAIGGQANLIVPTNNLTGMIANVIPGCPIPTPILITILMGIIFFLVFRFTSLRLYAQSVGINQHAARLNGINATAVKLICFGLLGFCCAIAGIISETRLLTVQKVSYGTQMVNIEMEAILAVAIGGNSLGGGKFKLSGAVLGAYAYKLLTRTLYCVGIDIQNIKAYQAVVIIILVVVSAETFKEAFRREWGTTARTSLGSKVISIFNADVVHKVVLSILFPYVFFIRWEYMLIKNVRALQNDNRKCVGELLCLLLVPLYPIYWWYTRGKAVRRIFAKNGVETVGTENLYLLFSFLGLHIISTAIMQGDFNALFRIEANENTQTAPAAVKEVQA